MAGNQKKTEEVRMAVPKVLKVNTNTVLGSTYAQIVGVSVTDTDVTLEFVYKNPREEIEEAQVVSRVTLPRIAGEGLSRAILDTIKEHEAGKEKKNG